MNNQTLSSNHRLSELVAANAPYWGAEGEIIASYWDHPTRSPATDRKWVLHQVYKEYEDGIIHVLDKLATAVLDRDAVVDTDFCGMVCRESDIIREESEHMALFIALYQQLDTGSVPLTGAELVREGSWSANDALMSLRREHRERHPVLGRLAHRFTEGGYCALFREGMKLRGRGGFDEAIADVCEQIYNDEFDHMLDGMISSVATLEQESDWLLLEEFTVEQMQARCRMRQCQFSNPLPDQRLQTLLSGGGASLPFEYERAENRSAAQAS